MLAVSFCFVLRASAKSFSRPLCFLPAGGQQKALELLVVEEKVTLVSYLKLLQVGVTGGCRSRSEVVAVTAVGSDGRAGDMSHRCRQWKERGQRKKG